VDPATIASLAAGHYLEHGEPVVLLGDSGTGGGHLLIGLGMTAFDQERSVRYVTCAQLVNELAEAAGERHFSNLIPRYGQVDLLFQLSTEREETSSIATASNLLFAEWGKVIVDARLVAAITDRLTFSAHIIETGSGQLPAALDQGQTRDQGPLAHLLESGVDLADDEGFGIEVATRPLHVVLVLLVRQVSDDCEELFIARRPPDVFTRAGPSPVEAHRVTQRELDRLDRFDFDEVLPVVAEVVLIGERVAHCHQRSEFDAPAHRVNIVPVRIRDAITWRFR
jgi:hypothetical protein